jgi:hypothetical protein
MRSVSDRGLPEPYRTWIDRSGPLPAGVRLLPRTVDVGTDVVTFLGVGGMFGGMGALMLVLLRPWRLDPVRDGWAPVLIMGAILLALGSVPVLLLRRMVRTLGARADLRRGTLRQGILLGPEGMLVRMEPGGGHAIAADGFVGARLFPPAESKDRRKRTLVVETRDGEVEFFAERLSVGPRGIHDAAREVWPSWREPPPLLKKNRKKQADSRTRRKMWQATYVFVGAMLVVFVALGGVIAIGGESGAKDWFSFAVFLGLLVVAGSVVNLFYRLWALKVSYRCPECGARPVRVFEALPDVHFYCRACNVEWDTGLKELADQS